MEAVIGLLHRNDYDGGGGGGGGSSSGSGGMSSSSSSGSSDSDNPLNKMLAHDTKRNLHGFNLGVCIHVDTDKAIDGLTGTQQQFQQKGH